MVRISNSFIIWLFLFVFLLLPPPANCQTDSPLIHYLQDDSLKLTANDILKLNLSGGLKEGSSYLNLGFDCSTVWIVIHAKKTSKQQVLTIQNAHLDVIDIYYYSKERQIARQKSGDHLDFSNRDLNNNFFNFFIPKEADLIIMRASSEGPIFIPISLLSEKKLYDLLSNYSIFHWMYFGFVLLMLLSNALLFLWLRETLYLYHILLLCFLAMLTAVDYGYSFQYLWPHHPEINRYNTLFYLGSVSVIIFTDKLFNTKSNFPKIHLSFKAAYLAYLILAVITFFTTYRHSIQIFTYVYFVSNLSCLILSIYFHSKIKNSVSTFSSIGWTAFMVGNLGYTVFLFTSVDFNFLFNNITQIASAIQIIFFNLAVLANINVLRKEKEVMLSSNNEQLGSYIKEKDELIKAIVDRERVLSDERVRISTILNTSGGLIIMLDRSGKIVVFNNACVRCTGYTFEELEGKVFWDYLIPKDEAEAVKSVFFRLLSDGLNAIPYENNWITKSGELRYIVWSSKAIVDERGRIDYVLGTGIDITDKIALERLAKSKEVTFNTIVNSMNDVFFALDNNLKVVNFNEVTRRTFSHILSHQLTIAHHIGEGLKRKSLAYIRFYRDKFKQTLEGQSFSFTSYFEEADRYFDVTINPILEENQITGLFVLARDITEKVRQQEELRLNEEKYRTLVEHSPAAILIFDFSENKIAEPNAQARHLFGTSAEKFQSLKPFDLLPEFQENKNLSRDELKKHVDKTINNENVNFEIEIIDSKGNIIPTEIWLNRLPVKEKLVLRATILDISERRKHQNELNAFIKFQEELINKIKEKELSVSAVINSSTDYIFAVDHELNLTEFNDGFRKVINSSFGVELIKGTNFKRFILPEVFDNSIACFRKAFEGQWINDVAEFRQKGTGELTYMSTVYSPIFSTQEDVVGVAVISRDITEGKKIEEQLIEITRQVADYKLKALRSAMNPHFIFNVLSSIQYFIVHNDQLNGLNYLTSFSKLMRSVLTRSSSETASVKEEVDVLKEYIHLEQLRFDQKFDFVLEYDPDLELELYEIPPLLIQPYIENAILHGLCNKETTGTLTLRIKLIDDYLVFEIEDTGVGRSVAQQIKENTKTPHKSLGTQLTEERLKLFNGESVNSVSYKDLIDNKGKPAGTLVQVKIKAITPE